jgi:prevent-host-death family protein
MDEPISAAEANRQFSRLLREVREEGASYVITSHGKPVARIVPIDAADEGRDRARAQLLDRLKKQSLVKAKPWSRDELYERER